MKSDKLSIPKVFGFLGIPTCACDQQQLLTLPPSSYRDCSCTILRGHLSRDFDSNKSPQLKGEFNWQTVYFSEKCRVAKTASTEGEFHAELSKSPWIQALQNLNARVAKSSMDMVRATELTQNLFDCYLVWSFIEAKEPNNPQLPCLAMQSINSVFRDEPHVFRIDR